MERQDASFVAALQFLRKTSWLVVLLAALVAVAVFEIEKSDWLYTSETRFYVNESLVLDMTTPNPDPTERAIISTMSTNRVLLLVNSDELVDSVVQRFDLNKHYETSIASVEKAHAAQQVLTERIAVERDPNNGAVIILKVRDADRRLAADIANYIVAQLNKMNKAMIRRDVLARINKFEKDLNGIRREQVTEKEQIRSFVDSLQPNLKSVQDEMRDPVTVQLKSYEMFGKLDDFSTKYAKILVDYYSTLNNIDNNVWESISVIKKATPNAKGSFDACARQAGLAFLLSLVIIAVIFVQLYTYWDVILFLLGVRKEVPPALMENNNDAF